MCNIRICTDPNDQSDCDKPTCKHARRKRRDTRRTMNDKALHTSVQTQFEVYDTDLGIQNGVESSKVFYAWTMVCSLILWYFRLLC